MTIKMLTAAAAVALISAAAPAQDLPTDQLDQHADTVRQRILLDKTVNRDRKDVTARDGASARARATCANKRRAAANLGRDNPKVRRLYALCAQAGY